MTHSESIILGFSVLPKSTVTFALSGEEVEGLINLQSYTDTKTTGGWEDDANSTVMIATSDLLSDPESYKGTKLTIDGYSNTWRIRRIRSGGAISTVELIGEHNP